MLINGYPHSEIVWLPRPNLVACGAGAQRGWVTWGAWREFGSCWNASPCGGCRRAAPRLCGSPGPLPPTVSQSPAERREGEAQAAGPARHGAAPQAVALQAPRQPIPHQDREDTLGSRLADDSSAGNGDPPLIHLLAKRVRSGHT